MSNRAVKKLKQRLQKQEEDDEVIEEPQEEVSQPAQRKFNVFELLGDEENNEGENDDEQDQEDENVEEETPAQQKQTTTSINSKKKKKKNKAETEQTNSAKQKNKKKNVKGPKKDKDLEFLEQEIKKMGTATATQSEATTTTSTTSKYRLVGVQKNNLNPDNEFKKLFGNIIRDTSSSSAGLPPGMKQKMAKAAPRSTTFVTYRQEKWPQFFNPGIHLSLVNTTAQGTEVFQIEYSQLYQKVEEQFLVALESHDPNNLVHILHSSPWHVSTLLQLVEIYRMQNDNDLANDFLERALLSMEACLTSAFYKAAVEGRARIPYYPVTTSSKMTEEEWFKAQANQQLFHVILKRVHVLRSTGCYVTGLEYCKFLLQLSLPQDPCRILSFIDSFALSARQFDYLLQLIEEIPQLTGEADVANLPNLVYSKAIALFLLKRIEESDKALQYALQLWPMALPALLEKLGSAISFSQWEPLIRNTIFTDQVCTSATFASLIAVGVDKQAEIWKQPQTFLVDWLKKNVQLILNKKVEPTIDFGKKRQELYKNEYITKNYLGISTAEVQGKVLPPSTPVAESSTTSSSSSSNPLMWILQSILPWNHSNMNNTSTEQ